MPSKTTVIIPLEVEPTDDQEHMETVHWMASPGALNSVYKMNAPPPCSNSKILNSYFQLAQEPALKDVDLIGSPPFQNRVFLNRVFWISRTSHYPHSPTPCAAPSPGPGFVSRAPTTCRCNLVEGTKTEIESQQSLTKKKRLINSAYEKQLASRMCQRILLTTSPRSPTQKMNLLSARLCRT